MHKFHLKIRFNFYSVQFSGRIHTYIVDNDAGFQFLVSPDWIPNHFLLSIKYFLWQSLCIRFLETVFKQSSIKNKRWKKCWEINSTTALNFEQGAPQIHRQWRLLLMKPVKLTSIRMVTLTNLSKEKDWIRNFFLSILLWPSPDST